ncbi:MAG: tRNA dihydrouridine synthase DusB [Desulfobacterales bacterium]
MNETFNIGKLQFDSPTVMAPMAGVTDSAFRKMVKKRGCALVCSEMISANGLCHGSEKTFRMMEHKDGEKPLSIQIFGAKPANMARAARMAEQSGADIIDINCGCAVKKVVKTGAGAALMKNRGASESVIRAVCEAVKIPVTVKMRSGWEPSGEDALLLARIAQDCGADAVTVHPRTAKQRFSGKADKRVIADIKQALSIPVIGNGDIRTAGEALEMMNQTGCDAVMIGRAAVGDPWIFSRIRALLSGTEFTEPDLEMRFSEIKGYVSDMVSFYGETHACRIMRSRLGWLLKGLPQASRWREALTGISTKTDAYTILDDYQNQLSEPNLSDFQVRRTTDSTKPITKSA